MDYTGIEQITENFSDAGREACRALDYNEKAFSSDYAFLSCLAGDLFNDGGNLRWKYEKGYISQESIQVGTSALNLLPKIPIVEGIIQEIRKFMTSLGINEVCIENPTEPKKGDRMIFDFGGGAETVDVQEVKDGFVYFGTCLGKRRTSITNLRFTRNLQMGRDIPISVGEGWEILDKVKIESVD